MSDDMRGVLFEPTEEQRRLVRALAGFGVIHDDIARQVGCEPKTLRKHFRDELDRGSVEATAKVAQSLFQMATTGKNVAAAIFWMKCRGGWREKSQVEHSGDVRQSYVIFSGVPRTELTAEEWVAPYSPYTQGEGSDGGDEGR